MTRLEIYQYIINYLENTYIAKNEDYGNSVADTYKKYGDISFLVRITDKFNRIQNLYCKDPTVTDETLDDTILDMANYLILWKIERDMRG